MKKTIFTITLLVTLTLVSHAQAKDSYAKELKTMLEITGSQEMFITAIDQMTAMYKQQKTEVPETVWNEINSELTDTAMKDIVASLIPVYKKYLTKEDLQGMIAFYKTPLGKKFAENTPEISKESMQIGQQWGMKLNGLINKRIEEKGY